MKAKTIILLLTIVFISINSHAQTNVSYTYDSAGNRNSRTVVAQRGDIEALWPNGDMSEKRDSSKKIIDESVPDIDSRTKIFEYVEKEYPQYKDRFKAFYEGLWADYRAGHGLRSGQIDTTLAIGRIPLETGTTPSGGRTYSVPIPSAAGLKFAPSVSLEYSSQRGNGLAGYGWEIGGLSEIRLINKNNYYHGTVAPANIYDSDKVFSLDGTPLVTNDAGTLYNEGFTLQTVHGNVVVKKHVSNGVVTHFTALFPDGSKATYGWVGTPYNLISYPITEKEDILGNKIKYQYSTFLSASLQIYEIIKIEYGFLSNGTHLGEILFQYETRSDCCDKYYAAVKSTAQSILKGITSKSRNGSTYDTICQYSLTHTMGCGVNQLTRIDAQSGGSSLNPITFKYRYEKEDYDDSETLDDLGRSTLSQYFPSAAEEYVNHRGRFISGSSIEGLVIYPSYQTYKLLYSFGNNKLYGSEYSSSQTLLVSPDVCGQTIGVTEFTAGSGFQTLQPADVDGDGTHELVKINFGTSSGKTRLTFNIYKYNPHSQTPWTTFNSFNVLVTGVVVQGYTSPAPRDYYFGDFNGDGKDELIAVSYVSETLGLTVSNVALIDLNQGTLLYENANLMEYPSMTHRQMVPVDMDGDGKTELCAIADNGMLRLYNTTGSSVVQSNIISGGDSGILANGRPHLADINCDGYMDFVNPGTGTLHTSLWTAYLYTGQQIVIPSTSLQGMSITDSTRVDFLDLNMDGLWDVSIKDGTTLRTGINRGNGTFDFSTSSPITVSPHFKLIPCEANSAVSRFRYISIQTDTVLRYRFPEDRSFGRLVYESVDSYGNMVGTDYLNMADNNHDIYLQESSYVPTIANGYYKTELPIWLLWWDHRIGANRKFETSSSYRYYDLVINKAKGIGICGFRKVKEDESIQEISTSTVYNPELFGVVTSVKDSLLYASSAPKRVFRTVYNTYSVYNHSSRKEIPRLSISQSCDSLTTVTTKTRYYYTDYDLLAQIQTNRWIGNDISHPNIQTELISYTSSLLPSKYYLGAVTTHKTWNEYGGTGPGWEDRTEYTYDSNYLPLTEKHFSGTMGEADGKVSETRYTYDSRGNVLTEKSAKYNTTSYYGWTYTYDSNGRYLTSKTDAIGLKTQYSNYDKFGNPQTVKDYNRNKTTTHTYDAWGNLVRTVHPDGSIDSVQRRWGGAGLYTIKTKSTGKPDRIVHYDALEREIRKGEMRFDGHWGYTDTRYNSRGQLDSVSLPYKDTTLTPTYWNTYSYDAYGRPTRKQNASGKVTNYSYSGTTTTTVVEGLTYYQVTDASGNVTQDRSYYGNVNYSYRHDNQLSSITTTQGQTISFAYDSLGRRTGIADPNSGTRTTAYQWNSDGSSVVTETNPNGSIVTSYDQYGRVTGINYPGRFSTAYTYNSRGELTGETSTHGVSKSYSYDQYGRLSIHKESVPGIPLFAKYISYGPGSNLSAIYYSDESQSLTSEHYIYQNGHNVATLLPDNTEVIRIRDENSLGQVTRATSGGNTETTMVTRRYEFDDYGYPTRRFFGLLTGTAPDDEVYTDESYSFNHNTGNLQSRNSMRFNETFGYDLVNRLYGNTASNYWYGINGNISWRNDGGQQTFQATGSDGYKLTSLRARTDSLVAPRSQTISYTGFDRPDVITEGDRTCRFTYDASRSRVRTVIAEGDSTILKRWYAGGNYEKDSTAAGITERIYLGGDAYSAPAVLVRRTNRPDTFFSIGRDYQGSITYLRSKDGQESYEYNYDPWGNVRYADGDTLALSYRQVPELFLGRGYTGHEHLPYFGLINMNARLYDPVTTRFLSPDPFVQAPHDFQNYNRYSYCLNNPLKYTDESGEYFFWDDLFAALAGGVINWATNGCKFSWEGLSYFGVGAATGWASLYISPVLASGLTSGANSIISQGFGNNGQWSWSNINWGSAAFSAIVGGATSYLGGQLSSMVSNSLGKLTSMIPGKAWAGMLNKGVTGFVSGFTVGGAINALNQSKTDDPFEWKSFWSSALNTGLMGLATGAITGTAEGIIEARANNENPWAFTKKQLNPRQVHAHIRSVGAKSANINIKRIPDKWIRKYNIPAETIKREYFGDNAKVKFLDLYYDNDWRIWIYLKNAKGEGQLTSYTIRHY